MKTFVASILAVSVLVAAPALAEEDKAKTEATEKGVESIAEEADDAPAKIPNALKGDQMGTESTDGAD